MASPGYLRRKGAPSAPDDLRSHDCLGFTNHPDWPEWVLEKAGELVTVRPHGPLVANLSETIMVAALKGAGIALAPDWMATPHLNAGDWMFLFERRDHSPSRRRHPAIELGFGKTPGPAVEKLYTIGARANLLIEVSHGHLDQKLDQPREACRIAISPQPRLRLVGRAAPADHVRRHR